MFTTQGARNLLRTVADAGLVSHMALGVGTTAATTADSRLDCEYLRIPITSATPDYVNNVIVYKATVAAEDAIDIREIGLVNSPVPSMTLLTDFTETNFWSGGSTSVSNVRVGPSLWWFNPTASNSMTANGAVTVTWADADEIVVAYFVGANVASISLRFQTDASNYYGYSLPTTAGYQIVRIPRASFTTTGTPGTINSTSVIVTATAGGVASVHMDALFVNDTADREPELVIRRVLGANVVKAAGIARDVEYTVTVTGT